MFLTPKQKPTPIKLAPCLIPAIMCLSIRNSSLKDCASISSALRVSLSGILTSPDYPVSPVLSTCSSNTPISRRIASVGGRRSAISSNKINSNLPTFPVCSMRLTKINNSKTDCWSAKI